MTIPILYVNCFSRVLSGENRTGLSRFHLLPDYTVERQNAIQRVCSGAPARSPNVVVAELDGALDTPILPECDLLHRGRPVALGARDVDDEHGFCMVYSFLNSAPRAARDPIEPVQVSWYALA